MNEEQARKLVSEFYQRVDGGYCSVCTEGAITSVLQIFPELSTVMMDQLKIEEAA